MTLEEAIAIVEKNANTPSKGSKAGKFGSKASAKPKPKETKPKTPKETKPKKANTETKPKTPKEPKAKKEKVSI